MNETDPTTPSGTSSTSAGVHNKTNIPGSSSFLHRLFGNSNGFIEFRAIKSIGVSHRSKSLFFTSYGEISRKKLRALNRSGYNIYVGVGTRKHKRGTKSSVHEIPALWVDIDCSSSENKRHKLQEIYNAIKRTRFKPSILVDSGNGFHLYFLLESPIPITNAATSVHVEEVLKGLAVEFQGDNVNDISRVMRLPGFFNLKDSSRPKKCKVLRDRPGLIYKLSDFESIRVPKSSDPVSKIELGDLPSEVPQSFYDLLKSDERVRSTWEGKRGDLEDKTGSGLDMALASLLVKKPFKDEEIARILLDSPYKKNNPRTTDYLQRTISKARFAFDDGENLIKSISSRRSILCEMSLGPEDFEGTGVEYLIDGFLPKNSLMLLTSAAGVGKSILSIALGKTLLNRGHELMYVDGDMSKEVVEQRLYDSGLMGVLKSSFYYFHRKKSPFKISDSDDNWKKVKYAVDCGGFIVILDNFKELSPVGADLDHDATVIPIMNELKTIRDYGNTVILLHHVKKGGGPDNPFKNSGSIADAVDIAYLLERRDNIFTLNRFKDRIPVDKEVVFELGESEFYLSRKSTPEQKKQVANLKEVYDILRGLTLIGDDISQGRIVEECMKTGMSRDKVRRTLDEGEGKLWSKRRGDKKTWLYALHPEAQNSKNPASYIEEKFGILDFKDARGESQESGGDGEGPAITLIQDGDRGLPEYLQDDSC